jgi:2-polyprenyl-3-methyl-5-hydroxy-6-metoxy-1,4-benzoquinol methylase
MGELDDIEHALLKHSSALELGCGNGRLCERMAMLGLQVAGVDESEEMLALLPPGIEGILSSIETLNLGRQWSAVLLPSHLINHPDQEIRSAFVATAKRHTSAAGTFFVKRHNPSWLATVQPGLIGTSHGVTYYADQVARHENRIAMTLRYEVSGKRWTQSFSTTAQSEAEIEAQLSQHGFGRFEWFGPKKLWVSAVASDA